MRFKSILFAFAAFSLPAFCSAEESKINFSTTELAPGIYMLAGKGGFVGGNIGLSVGKDGVVMIDDAMPPFLEKLQKSIAEVSGKPVDYLLNTHVHFDHLANNAAMSKAGAHIVAHQNLRESLLTKGLQTFEGTVDAPEGALPVITFSKSMSFHLNNEDIELIHLPNAHTDADSIIVFKQSNIIHAGDIFFNGMYPYIDYANGGSIEGYIAAQKAILALCDDKTKIIPGHGPLASKKDLQNALAVLEASAANVKALVEKGLDEEESVKKNPLAKYHEKWNWQFISTEKMTRQMYQGLTKKPAGHKSGTHKHSH